MYKDFDDLRRKDLLSVKLNGTSIPLENFGNVCFYLYSKKGEHSNEYFDYTFHCIKGGKIYLRDGSEIPFSESEELLFEIKDDKSS